jgi:acyl-[acyl-carrier-protein]-phospholipid O-acyltransferase/long-chain-fatty-acid--[acyl-carrier-protein] ligase
MGKNFFLLNFIQFLDALNENVFKYIVIYYLIFAQGHKSASLIMSLTGVVFILPFILFSSLGGLYADRFSKTNIIQKTRLLQIALMVLAFFCIFFRLGNWIYLLLFMTTFLSAIFGPSKYGIISEVVTEKELLKANGYIAAYTYFGIILGTALASLLSTLTEQTFYLMVVASIAISILGTVLSYFMDPTKAIDPKKPYPRFLYQEIFDSLIEMRKIPLMSIAFFCYGYFLFIGAFVQMNIIPYSISVLRMKPAVGGYLFLASSIGVGIGALMATQSSGKLSILPWAGAGMSLGCFLFTLFPFPFWINLIWLMGIGIFGGFFLVPPQAFILKKSPTQEKGRNFGTANFLSFLFALLAAVILYLFNTWLGVSPSFSFMWIGILNLLVCAVLFFSIREKKSYS